MIWLDAFSSRYVSPEKTPFIFELSQSGFYTTLEPLFAFAGIGVSAFTGTKINTHKVWADYVLSKSARVSPVLKRLLRLCDYLPDDIINQYARYAACRMLGRNPGTPNLIPVEFVDFFKVKERKKLTAEDPIKGMTTLFDQLRRHQLKYLVLGFYESVFEEQIVGKVKDAMSEDYRLIMFRLASPDRLGHKHGPDSKELGKKLREIDETVAEIIKRGTNSAPPWSFIFFSDHGMNPVKGHVDLRGILNKLPLKVARDYIVFLNSTVASFWLNNDKAKEIIIEELEKIKPGIILDNQKLKELGIDKIGPEYGELLFALREGYVFFPDFYRRRTPPKGMHGYAFSTYDKPPFIICSPDTSYSLNQQSGAEFINVMPTILDLLNLPVPSSCEGKSLLLR